MNFIYCPRCTNKLTKKQKNLYVCTNCELHIYENPRPTTAVIFENEDKEILLVKRKKSPKKGYWDTPGGFVDLNESLEDAVRREIKEELDIDIKKFTYLGSYYGRYFYKGINYYTLCFSFVAKIPTEKLKVSNEIARTKFFKKEGIPLKKIAFIEVKKTLEDYIDKRSLP